VLIICIIVLFVIKLLLCIFLLWRVY